MALTPEFVLPALRGSFGRTLYYEPETPSTQRLPPADAPHGAVALTEHQTAGRGRLGRVWIDEPGAGLALSVVLRPPPPVARWPELTLECQVETVRGPVGRGKVKATVDGQLAVRGTLTFAVGDEE